MKIKDIKTVTLKEGKKIEVTLQDGKTEYKLAFGEEFTEKDIKQAIKQFSESIAKDKEIAKESEKTEKTNAKLEKVADKLSALKNQEL